MTRLILHIGTEKTGTTTVQEFAAANRTTLFDRGILFPETLGMPRQPKAKNHIGLALIAQDAEPDHDTVRQILGVGQAGVPALAGMLRAQFRDEMRAMPAAVDTVFMSSEFLHSNLTRQSEAFRLREFLSEFFSEINVVVYLRRQDLLATSRFTASIKSGDPWRAFAFPEILGPLPYYFDYYRIADNYAKAFGKDNLVIRRFERRLLSNGDIIDDIAGLLGRNLLADCVRVSAANPSLTTTALKFLGYMNRFVPPFEDGRWNARRNNLVEFLEAGFPGSAHIASRQMAEDFYSHFKDGNERLRLEFCAGIAPPFFSEDFRSYDPAPDTGAPSFDDAIRVFAELWNRLASELDGRNADIDYLAIELMERDGAPGPAIARRFERALADHPDWPKLHAYYARWLAARGDKEKSAQHRSIAKSLLENRTG